MNWGARSLCRTATMVLLLQLLTRSSVVANPFAARTTRAANMTTAVDKDRRDGDQISEILIEHVGEDDAVMLPLLIVLLVLGAFIFLSLLVLGCLLVLRLCESGSAKYHRLRSDDSESHRYRSKTRRPKQSQVFTYVDLSNADCSCREHASEGQQQAPRFGVKFQAGTDVGFNDAHQLPERQGAPSPAPRKSRMAGMGLPSGEDNPDNQPDRRPSSTETNVNAPESTRAPADHPGEQPTQGVGVQSPVCMPRSYWSSANEGDAFDTYRERCTQFRSVIPQLEINVRDRFVKRHASSGVGGRGSPRRVRADHEAESAVTAQTTETTYAFHPDLRSSPPTEAGSRGGYDTSSDIRLSPTLSPGVSSVTSPYLQSRPRSTRPGDSVSEQTSPFGVEVTDVSGHGRYYEELAGSQSGKTATPDFTARRYSGADSAPKQHQLVTATSPSRIRHPVSALVEFPDNTITARNGSSLVTATDSTKLRELFENEEARTRQVITHARKPSEKPPVTPVRPDTNETLERVPSPWPSATRSPYQIPSREMSVPVPQVEGYLDHPQTVKSVKTTAKEKSQPRAVDMSLYEGPSRVQHMAELSASVSLAERTVPASKKLKLPMERFRKDLQAMLSDDQSAVTGSAPSTRKRRDDQSSTEPFSVDELSHKRASVSGTFSEIDASSDQTYAMKIAAVPPFVHPRSKPSFVSPVLSWTDSTPAVINGRPGLTPSSLEHAQEGRDVSLRGESTQGVEARADSVPLMTEEQTQTPKEVVARPSATSTTPARPVDSLELRTHAISGASPRVAELPPSAVFPSASAADQPERPITAKEGGWIQSSAHETLAQAREPGKAATRSGDKEAGGKLRALPLSAHDKEITGRKGTTPVETYAETDEGSLTPKEPLVFPLSSESEDAVGPIEEYDIKKKSLSDAAPPYATDLWTPFKVLSKEDREALSGRKQVRDTNVLPVQVLQKQLVASKEELLMEGKRTLPKDDTTALTGAPEGQVIPKEQKLLFDDDVAKEPTAAGSSAAPSVSVPPRTQFPRASYNVPAQVIPHAAIREKEMAVIGRRDHGVPGEMTGGQLSDVASAHDKQIFINEDRETVEQGPGGGSGQMATNGRHGALLSSEGSQEQVERHNEKGFSKVLHPSASRHLMLLPHAGKLISREEHQVSDSRSTEQEILARVPQASSADRQVSLGNIGALSGQTEVFAGPSAIAAQPKAEENAILPKQSSQLSSQNAKEFTALEDTAGKTQVGKRPPYDTIQLTRDIPQDNSSSPPQTLLFGPQPTFWDFTNAAIISRQEYTVPGEVTGGLFSDIISDEDNQIKSDKKGVAMARGPNTAVTPVSDVASTSKQVTSDDERVPMVRGRDTVEGKEITTNEQKVPMPQARDSAFLSTSDIVPAEDKAIASDEKKAPIPRARDTAFVPSSDVVPAEDKEVTTDETKVPVPRSRDTAFVPSSDVVPAEDKEITTDEKKVPMPRARDTGVEAFNDAASAGTDQIPKEKEARSRDTATETFSGAASTEDTQIISEVKSVPMARGSDSGVEPFSEVTFEEDKQITRDQKTLPMTRGRGTDTEPLNDIASAEGKQITSDQDRVPVTRSRHTAAAPFNDVASTEDKQITTDEKGKLMALSRDTADASLSDVISADYKQATIDKKGVLMARGRDTDSEPFNVVTSAEDKQITTDGKSMPMSRSRDSDIEPFKDVVSAEDRKITSNDKNMTLAPGRNSDILPFNDVASAKDKQITSDQKTVPMPRARHNDAEPLNDVVSTEDKQITSDEKAVLKARDRDTSVGVSNGVVPAKDNKITSDEKELMAPSRDTAVVLLSDVTSAEDKQITSQEKNVPLAQGRDTDIEPFNDVTFAEDKQITSDEKNVPMARSRDVIAGRFNDVVSAEDKLVMSEEKRDTTERGRDTGIGSLAAQEPFQVQESNIGVLVQKKPHEGGERSILEPAAQYTADQRSPFYKKDDVAPNREESEVPADQAQEPDRVELRTKVSDKQLSPNIEIDQQGKAAEEKIVPVIIPVKRSPPVSYADKEFGARENASGPSVTESVDGSQQHSPVTPTPPPQMLLHGLHPPLWGDKNSALITRQEYTVPGETTGGPFSVTERRHSGDLGSPKPPASRSSEDRETAGEASRPTEQIEKVLKTTPRRSSWADSSQSLRLPNLTRSVHSSVDLSSPAYGDFTHTSSETAFLSETLPVDGAHGKTTENVVVPIQQRSERLDRAESPGEEVLTQHVGETAEHSAAVASHAQLSTLISASTDQNPPAETRSLQAGAEADEVLLHREVRGENDKSEPRSGSNVTADHTKSDSPRSKSTPSRSHEESPSDVVQDSGSTTSSMSLRNDAVDRRHSGPPAVVSSDQRELVTSPEQHTSVDSDQQRSSVPVERGGEELATLERLKGQLKSAHDRTLLHPVTEPPTGFRADLKELGPSPVYEPMISSRLPPHWTPIERRKQELLANAKLNGEPKTPPSRASAQATAEPSAGARSAQRGVATPPARQADADSARHAKWFPIERPNQELSDRKLNGQLMSPPGTQQRESATTQASQWFPTEKTSQGASFYAKPNGQQRLPLPVSRHVTGTRPDAEELTAASHSAGVDADDSKSSAAVHSAVSPGTLESKSRNGRELIPAYDNSAAARIRPSDKLEHGVFVTPVEEQPSPSEADSSRRLAASPDVFFRKSSPVSAHGSKDLITFKPEDTSAAQAPGSPEEKWTRRLNESAAADRKDTEGPTEESKK